MASGASHEPAVGGRIGGSYDEIDVAAEKGAKDYISEVREGSLWVSLRDCLTPADVLVLRAAG